MSSEDSSVTEEQLKKRLEYLRSIEFKVQGDELSNLLPAMLLYIGSIDATLRDELIYSAFANWIYDQRLVTPKQEREILQVVLDAQHMFFHMGEREGDGVFTRAFSVLLLPLLLGVHRDQPYLSMPEIQKIKEKLMGFLEQEQDRRGFVPGKGWAHAVAHAADALDELALCNEMEQADLLEMLSLIRDMICDPAQVYTHGEEERLGRAALSIISRDVLAAQEVNDWVASFREPVLAVQELPALLYIRANVRNFLQSLYFRLRWVERLTPYDTAFDHTLHGISCYTD